MAKAKAATAQDRVCKLARQIAGKAVRLRNKASLLTTPPLNKSTLTRLRNTLEEIGALLVELDRAAKEVD